MRPILETERLVLRPITIADAKNYAAYVSTEDVARMTGSIALPFPVMSAEFWIMEKLSKVRRGMSHIYVIELAGEIAKSMIGVIDLFKRDPDGPLEIGYSLAPEAWGNGYATEACKAIINEAYETLGAKRIVAGVFADNPASIKLLHKLGFTTKDTHQQWFSMARMEKARGIYLSLDLSGHNSPLHSGEKIAISA
ncbi:MAG: GNAT family N-acetyltransferase [Maricaulaceae bacterium]